MTLEAAFQRVDGSDRFCLWHLPEGKPRGGIVYLHPFAEEMNRARSVVARQAKGFAAAGYAVLQMDLYGCGDSAGDFSEASWAGWRSDARAAMTLMQDRFNVPLCLWGLRAGGLLANEAAREVATDISLLLWQPVLSGQQHLQQFLRLSLAADMLDGRGQGGTERLLARLASGEAIEVAGYTLSPALAEGLAASNLAPPAKPQHMHCIEIAPGAEEVSPALVRFAAGSAVQLVSCDDAQCWLTQGVQAAPVLGTASLAAMRALLP